MSPFRLGFRVCDRRYPFLWHTAGQKAGRWNRAGDQPVHYFATTPTVAWAECARLALVDQLREQGAQGLLAPSTALQGSDRALPCIRVRDGTKHGDALPIPAAMVLLLWCAAEKLPGWCYVPEGRPGPELLPLVRREGMVARLAHTAASAAPGRL